MWEGTMITVFSASNYVGSFDNDGTAVTIHNKELTLFKWNCK
jgi:hypothetical protein